MPAGLMVIKVSANRCNKPIKCPEPAPILIEWWPLLLLLLSLFASLRLLSTKCNEAQELKKAVHEKERVLLDVNNDGVAVRCYRAAEDDRLLCAGVVGGLGTGDKFAKGPKVVTLAQRAKLRTRLGDQGTC